jgi:hypothetical protein
MRLPRVLTALVVAAPATWAACASFSGEDAPPAGPDASSDAADAPAVDDAGGGEGGTGRSIVVDDVPAPTELALAGTTMYIATGGTTAPAIYTWTVGAPTASESLRAQGEIRALVPEGTDRLLYLAGTTLFLRPLSGADAGVSVTCKTGIRAFTSFGSYLPFALANDTFGYTSNVTCAGMNLAVDAATELFATDNDTLFRYEPVAAGGQIAACQQLSSCAAASRQIAKNLGNAVRAMAVDTDRVYWATADSVYAALKAGGATPTTLATGQGGVRRLAVSQGWVYWTNYDGGRVMRAPSDGSQPPLVVEQNVDHPWGLVVTPNEIYIAASGSNRILRSPRQ